MEAATPTLLLVAFLPGGVQRGLVSFIIDETIINTEISFVEVAVFIFTFLCLMFFEPACA